jgi:hypothetical protein
MNCFLIFTLIGIITMNGNFAYSHVSPPSVAMTGKIQKQVAPMLAKKYNMQLCGAGGGMPDGIVNMLALSYDLKRSLTIEQARPILIDCLNTYVNAVNADTELRPYLKNYPFTPKNIEIHIFFQTLDGGQVCDPFLCVASSVRGKLIYNTEEKGQKFGYKTEVIETYEDAVKILNERKNTP